MQEQALLKVLNLNAELLSAGALLQSAINKLESYGKSASARLSKDKGFVLLSVIAKTGSKLQETADAINKLQQSDWEELVVSTACNKSARQSLVNETFAEEFMPKIHHEIFQDCIRTYLAEQSVLIDQSKDKVLAACMSKQQGGTDDWQHGLASTDDFSKVTAAAKSKWKSLDADALDNLWVAFMQAWAFKISLSCILGWMTIAD